MAAVASAAVAPGDEGTTQAASTAKTAKGRLTFLSLPVETQREIISHCSPNDLICASLVSKHFHELASTFIYRDFHIIFPDEDDDAFDSPIDGLASGLDTLTTSEYNYARHLRNLSLDTLSSGRRGELSYQHYLYSSSCGKFLNTLLYLALRRAKSLEAFQWNIRVELTRQVYAELHRMPSLKTLQIRMQAGESYYVPPPPLPPSGPAHSGPNHGPEPPAHIMHQAASPLPTIPSTVSLPLAGGAPPLAAGPSLVPPSKSLPRSRTSKQNGRTKEPSTLSGFRSLRSLSVLDIDNLDIVPELKDCIMNSSSTLTELQLSLSDHLASQARKPPPDSDVDDSDVDDDFQLTPSHSIANDGSASAKAFRAQEERKVHEALLGRLFGVELPIPLPKVPVIAQSTDDSSKDAPEAAGPQEIKDAHQEFVAALRSVSEQLMTVVHGTSSRSDAHQEILETIEKAARKYVDSAESNNEEAADEGRSNSQGSGPAIPPVEQAGESSNSVQTAGLDASTSTNDTKGKALNEDERALEEIDIEHPVEMDDGNDNDESLDDKKAGVGSNTSPPAINGIRKAAEGVEVPTSAGIHEAAPDEDASEEEVRLLEEVKSLQSNMDGIKDRMLVLRSKGTPNQIAEIEILEEKVRVFESTIIDLSSQLRTLQELRKSTKSNTITNETSSSAGTKGPLRQSVFDYLRETRGFALETLSIYLIPVKASVLSRAIDLGSLKSLTLLNVGNQASIWTLLSKENKVQPLALRNVFTDHVSDALLICLSQLEELHEFLVVEQNAKSKPESTAPRTSNTIDHIRRTVLAKHMGTLKRIMIKDETTTSNWDVNEKTIVHMCTHGRRLEELAIGLNLHAVHALMQYIGGLPKLRALHILHFRNTDTCMWVMREIRRFIVDNLSHHPESNLEFIAMEDEGVDRVVRTPPPDEDKLRRERRKKQALKDNRAALETTGLNIGGGLSHTAASSAYPVLPSITLDSDSDSDSEDDGSRLRFKTIGLMFYDVWGIKIFEKEVRGARL